MFSQFVSALKIEVQASFNRNTHTHLCTHTHTHLERKRTTLNTHFSTQRRTQKLSTTPRHPPPPPQTYQNECQATFSLLFNMRCSRPRVTNKCPNIHFHYTCRFDTHQRDMERHVLCVFKKKKSFTMAPGAIFGREAKMSLQALCADQEGPFWVGKCVVCVCGAVCVCGGVS